MLAVGHSARTLYEHLLSIGVRFTPKDFACGFRVEHPQEVINSIQYGQPYADMVQRGKGLLPVADYRLAVEVPAAAQHGDGAGAVAAVDLPSKQPVFSFCMCPGGQIVPTSTQVRAVAAWASILHTALLGAMGRLLPSPASGGFYEAQGKWEGCLHLKQLTHLPPESGRSVSSVRKLNRAP